MNTKSPDLFAALANPIRLRIASLLRVRKEICVCDLCEVLGEAQPTVSRHLAILRDAGLIQARTEGKWKFYALAPAPSPLHRSLLRAVDRAGDDFEQLELDRTRLEGIESGLRCC